MKTWLPDYVLSYIPRAFKIQERVESFGNLKKIENLGNFVTFKKMFFFIFFLKITSVIFQSRRQIMTMGGYIKENLETLIILKQKL